MSALTDTIHLAFTIDCEQLHADYQLVSKGEGPRDWDASDQAIRAFAEMVEGHQGRATFYVVPETARHHPELLSALMARGHEVGLHLHPCVFEEPGRYNRGLARHDRDGQRRLLVNAWNTWRLAVGRNPLTFRPGNFSADDNTFAIAVALGMKHGSMGCPGRLAPVIGAVWTGAPPWPNIRSGFTEVPLTTWPDRLRPNGFPLELRLERTGDSPEEMPLEVLRHRLGEFAAWPAHVPRCIVALTHTSVPYHKRPERETGILAQIIEECSRFAAAQGKRLKIGTIQQIAAAIGQDPRVAEGNRS